MISTLVIVSLLSIAYASKDATNTKLSISGPTEGITLNKNFLISCNVTTEPDDEDLQVIWLVDDVPIETKPGKYQILSNNTLKVLKASQEDCKTYTCKVNITDVDMRESFSVQSKPLIPWFEKSKSIIEGDKLYLNCSGYGNPLPRLSWLKGDLNVSTDDRIKVVFEMGNISESFLTIDAVEETDRDTYTCVANNDIGEYRQHILVRVKDKLAALWPFLGIVAEVAVLCTIIFIYEKRRAKQEFDESDTDQSPDTKTATENKDKEVRQRK